MTNEAEINDCPFCGGSAEFEYSEQDDGMGRAQCKNHKCGVYIFDDLESAAKKWNKRITSVSNINTALVSLNRALEEIENGFVACSTCGSQEDTKTLDFVEDLKIVKESLIPKQKCMSVGRHIYILAGSQNQASYFAKGKSLHPQNWSFLHKGDQLRGIRGEHYIRVGRWNLLRNIEDIERMILEREMIECTNVSLK